MFSGFRKILLSSSIILLLGASLFLGFGNSIDEEEFVDLTKEQIILKLIMDSLKGLHYNSQALDDEFSERVFTLYFDQLDGAKRVFMKQDIIRFAPYKHNLDDLLLRGDFEFFKETKKAFLKRIDFLESYVLELLSKPVNFKKNDFFIMQKADDKERAKDLEELKLLWKKILYYNILQEINEEHTQQEENLEKKKNKDYLSEKEIKEKAINTIKESQLKTFKTLKALDDQDWLSFYLNSFTGAYDPHTNYMPPRDKESFDISMSGRLQGIGATLTEEEGHITVKSIVVGSPCWKQGSLQVDDKILMVTETDTDVITNLVGMRVDQAVSYIRGKKGTEVQLTVEHTDNSREVIPIIRDIIEIEESYVKKSIFNDVGYIYLPKFYADFMGTDGPSCADDVKRAIAELKKENVKGIILDVRDNGGGSLQEVVEMSSLFIEKGPIVQVKSKIADKVVMSDKGSRIQYDGPLVILVSDLSASASEILAAAMQDYNRAIIIGSANSTFGKGTVQRAIDLDNQLKGARFKEIKPFGALKLTLQKFYRIDGSSTQLKGIKPDIILPSSRTYLTAGEAKQKYAIPWDTISSAKYDTWSKLDKKYVISQSKKRIDTSTVYNKIKKYAKWLKKNQDGITKIPLNVSDYDVWRKKRKKIIDDFNETLDDVPTFNTRLTNKDLKRYKTDTIYATKIDNWFEMLEKDIYVAEAANVIEDINNH